MGHCLTATYNKHIAGKWFRGDNSLAWSRQAAKHPLGLSYVFCVGDSLGENLKAGATDSGKYFVRVYKSYGGCKNSGISQ